MIQPRKVLCEIPACTSVAEEHHEPPVSILERKYRKDPRFRRPLCSLHHGLRHDVGYAEFKHAYPSYSGISIEDYRQIALAER